MKRWVYILTMFLCLNAQAQSKAQYKWMLDCVQPVASSPIGVTTGYAALFSGAQYISIPTNAQPSTSCAIMFWFKVATNMGSGAHSPILWEDAKDGNNSIVGMVNSDKIQFYGYYAGGYQWDLSYATNLNVNPTWHYYSALWSMQGGSVTSRLYFDGVNVGAKGGATGAFARVRLTIGHDFVDGYGSYWKGAIDEFQLEAFSFTTSAAADTFVANHYNSGAGRYAYTNNQLLVGYHFDENTGTNATDWSGAGWTGYGNATWTNGYISH